MTKLLLLLLGLASLSACNRIVDLVSSQDAGNIYYPEIDAAYPDGIELPADSGFGSIDAGPRPDGPYALPDAPSGTLDAPPFVTAVRTRT